MQDIIVYTKDGFKVDYHAYAIGWVMHEGSLHAVAYTHDGDTPWLVPADIVTVVV